MARKLNKNERIVPYEKARLRDISGRPGPVFQTYLIVDATNAPETAEMLKFGVSYVGSIEAPGDFRKISLTTLFRVAEALEVPAYKLLQFD